MCTKESNKRIRILQIRNNAVPITLFLILLIAVISRILPFLNGYHYFLTDDVMTDFLEVQYIQNIHQINWGDQSVLAEYSKLVFGDPARANKILDYGKFPALHLIIFSLSEMTNIPARYIHLFAPQLISAFGIIFFFLFLRRHVEDRYALFASFFLATFGPNIWWSAQGVRETIGLFFFPFVIYAFDKVMNKTDAKNTIILSASMLGVILTHHWTALILFFTLLFLMPILYQSNWKKPIFGTLSFGAVMFGYWYLKLPLLFTLIYHGINIIQSKISISIVIAVSLTLGIFLALILFKKSRLNQLYSRSKNFIDSLAAFTYAKSNKIQIILIFVYIITILIGYKIFYSILVFTYPFQEYLSLFLLGLFALPGVLLTLRKHFYLSFGFLLVNMVYFSLLIVGVFIGQARAFDPLRVIEFIIYPNALFASFGLLDIVSKIRRDRMKRVSLTAIILVLIVSGILIYPPVFIYHQAVSMDSPFYDVRSYIRYIPMEGIQIIKWGEQNEIQIYSNNPAYGILQKCLYTTKGKKGKGMVVSQYDYNVKESMEEVISPELGIRNPEDFIDEAKRKNKIYSNAWGVVYFGGGE